MINSIGKFFIVASLCLFASCRQVNKNVQAEPVPAPNNRYNPPRIVGKLEDPAIDESSGLVASRTTPGLYWTHNDSGDGPYIHAIGEHGEAAGVWRVTGARNHDWEDISIGPGPEPAASYLYVGDIGDNNASRPEVVVYRVLEPTPTLADRAISKVRPRLTGPAEPIRLRYPDGKHDAETLLIHPTTGNLYIITKIPMEEPTVYEAEAPLRSDKPIVMKSLGKLKLRTPYGGIITGGSVSPDGNRVALCDYFQGYELVLPDTSKNFDDIWKEPILSFDFGKRKQGESIAYRLDGLALLGTSEGRQSPIMEVDRR